VKLALIFQLLLQLMNAMGMITPTIAALLAGDVEVTADFQR
jgi:hypothetical protein